MYYLALVNNIDWTQFTIFGPQLVHLYRYSIEQTRASLHIEPVYSDDCEREQSIGRDYYVSYLQRFHWTIPILKFEILILAMHLYFHCIQTYYTHLYMTDYQYMIICNIVIVIKTVDLFYFYSKVKNNYYKTTSYFQMCLTKT